MFGFCFNFCRNSTKDSLDFAPHMLSPFLRLDICDHEVEMAILGSRKVKNKKTLAKPHDSTNTYAKLTKIDMTTKRCIDTEFQVFFKCSIAGRFRSFLDAMPGVLCLGQTPRLGR